MEPNNTPALLSLLVVTVIGVSLAFLANKLALWEKLRQLRKLPPLASAASAFALTASATAVIVVRAGAQGGAARYDTIVATILFSTGAGLSSALLTLGVRILRKS